jgi:hypothetical protein
LSRSVRPSPSQPPQNAIGFPIWRCSKPFNIMTLSRVDMPVSQAEGLKILERDQFCCRYCGLDGRTNFENAVVMSVDFVVPRAHKGKKDPSNLVACCRPCNMIKGKRVYQKLRGCQTICGRPARRDAPGLGKQTLPHNGKSGCRLIRFDGCRTKKTMRMMCVPAVPLVT